MGGREGLGSGWQVLAGLFLELDGDYIEVPFSTIC